VKLFGRKEKLTDGTEVLVDDAYIKESILNPAAKIVARHTPSMPVIPLTDSELEQILALIKSLK
jgi:cytochrome c oxidase subunit 2